MLILRFRPAGRVSFGSRPKRNQKVLPLHTALRCAQGSFAPPLLQGPAYKGHPWPFKPLAASMRLAPLRNDSTHPPERGGWCRLMVRASGQKKQILDLPGDSDSYPRQEAEWRCCVGGREAWTPSEERRTGPPRQGRPFVTAPGAAPEGGESGRRPDPDVGVAFSLVTFSWPDKSNEAKRSNSRRLARRASVASQGTRPDGRNQRCQHTRQ